jgi:hypothetical protein
VDDLDDDGGKAVCSIRGARNDGTLGFVRIEMYSVVREMDEAIYVELQEM